MRRVSLGLLLAVSACHDWEAGYQKCQTEGRCSEAGGGSGGATGGGSATGGAGATGGGGTVSGPALTWQTSGELGMLEPGQSRTVPLTVRNTGNAKASVLALELSDDGGVFSAGALGSCEATGPDPAGSCTTMVTFTATVLGDFTAQLTAKEQLGTASATLTLHGLSALADLPVTLRVDAGTGFGTLSYGVGTCPPACDFTLPRGVGLTLDAVPLTSTFNRWLGDCDGGPSCTRTVSRDGGLRAYVQFDRWPQLTIDIDTPVAGTHVLIPDAGLDCQGSCTYSFPPDAAVHLVPSPVPLTSFRSWTGVCNQGLPSPCDLTLNADVSVSAIFHGTNRIFISSVPTRLDIGRPALDQFCRNLANDAGLPGAPNGAWLAWLGNDAGLAPSTDPGVLGWVRPDGLPVGDALAAKHFYPPRLDEHGVDMVLDGGTVHAATGQGVPATGNCSDWTNDGGLIASGSAGAEHPFTFQKPTPLSCGAPQRIFCVQNQWWTPVVGPQIPPTGRVAFVSNGTVSGGSVPLANAMCTSEGVANLPGRIFVPLRAMDAGTTAASLVDVTGSTWYRVDGVRLLASPALLAQPLQFFDAPIALTGNGSVIATSDRAWTGAVSSGAPAANLETCTAWTATSGMGAMGAAIESGSDGFKLATIACNTPLHVYCFER